MTAYDAVLFDNDGVLVEPPDPETQHRAIRDAFRELGVESVDRQHLVDLSSGVTVDRLREVAGSYDLDPAALWAARERHDERSQIEAFRAGRRDRYPDVEAVADLTTARGVVSNNHHSTVAFVLDHFGMDRLFETYYGREMSVGSLRRKKPDPHYVERALSDLGAESGLYVGDSESDVLAAHRAGLDSAFVRRPDAGDPELSVAPTHEVSDLHEVGRIVAGSADE